MYAGAVEIRENISLAEYTTLGIGGAARWFAGAHSEDEMLQAVEFAHSRNLPLFVLGGGSNLLVADAGFPGLVLHVCNRGLRREEDGTHTLFTAAAGEEWDSVVATAVAANCAGMECLSGIPGTVGGTPVQNVGAYGQEVASTLVRVRALDRQRLAWVEFDNAACHFSYRRSLFNTTAQGRYLVTEVTYRLLRDGAPQLAYKDIARWSQQQMQEQTQGPLPAPTLAAVRAAVRAIRREKGMLAGMGGPDGHSAGSFFKNPVIGVEQFASLVETWPDAPHFPAGEGQVKVPAAWLMEQAGFHKGYALGAAGISSKHTLALINRGGATAAELLALRDAIRQRVAEIFGIALEQEPVYLSGE
ncbi:MAG: UDP-N-acetylmuramate dehydrogenase [Acidobacteriaceae bacterium]